MGLASALALRRHGASVVILDRDRGRTEWAVALLGDETPALVIDPLDSVALESAVGEAASRLGGLEILVNVVGMTHFATLDATSADAFRSELELNLTHVFVAASAFARLPSDCSSGRAVVRSCTSALRPGCAAPLRTERMARPRPRLRLSRRRWPLSGRRVESE
jgi:NAD(P)-dependent dehydrogenase (short-subunit alcohol dehydrogenase family)